MIRVDARHLSLLAGLWMLAGSGCVEEFPPVEVGPLGSARVVFVLPRAVPESTVAQVKATASGAEATQSLELAASGAQWQGWLRALPESQPYRFQVEAFDAAGARRFEGEVDSERLESSKPGLIIVVGEDSGAAAQSSGNTAPAIQAVVGSRAAVAAGELIRLRAQASDVDTGDSLSYTWEADEGTFDDAHSLAPTWTAPASSGQRTVTLVVTDSHGGATALTFTLDVTGAGTPGPQGLVLLNHWQRTNTQPPTLRAASPLSLSASPGELLKLSISAEDPQGGALTYDWKANTGILGLPVQTADTSEVPWTALSCVPTGVKPTIEVTVTNSEGLSLRARYQVTWNGPACGYPPCNARLEQELLTLQAPCTTDTPVFIPDGLTLDGAGHELVAVDPAAGHFVGAILRNRGATARVRNVKVRAQGLLKDGPCDAGDDRLRGILLQDASGSIVDSEVLAIHRNQPVADQPEGAPRGCQEGHAIEVRNRDASMPRQVEIRGNHVSGYQKVGILVAGRVDATIDQNTVTGAGPVGHIAQNGVQVSDGAKGQVTGNEISQHSYTGSSDVAAGLLVAGGPYFGIALVQDALVQGNTLTGNDVGIYLDQAEADGSGLATPTRIRVLDNTLRNDAVTNGYPYQAGISDLGGGNIIRSNTLIGAGYDPATQPGATFDVDVVAGAAAQVVFLTPPGLVATGGCSGKVVVQSQDSKGNLSKPSPVAFNLTVSGAAAQGVAFYSDPTCAGTPISSVDLSTPEAAASFYFKATQAGGVTLSVSNGSLTGSQNQTLSGP